MQFKQYIPQIVNVITIVGALAGAVLWAADNLASKSDINAAKKLSEFRTIELQLSFNDYRISEIERSLVDGQTIADADPETQRIYAQILDNTAKLDEKRTQLLASGAIQ